MTLEQTLKSILTKTLVAGSLIASAYGPMDVKADILLDDTSQQGQYSIVDDATKAGYEIMCTLKWSNISENVPANNQISANGTFGSNLGLYKINTDEFPHDIVPPTYTIDTDSFNIDYADGVVNTPNDSDTFKFFFNLGENIQTESEAQNVVDGLNDLINNPGTYTSDSAWKFKRDINGEVTYDGITPKKFENSPSAYVPGIPTPITNLTISASTLSWPSVSNTTYKIESNSDLLEGTWNTLTNITASGTNTVLDIATTNNVMFYRGKVE